MLPMGTAPEPAPLLILTHWGGKTTLVGARGASGCGVKHAGGHTHCGHVMVWAFLSRGSVFVSSSFLGSQDGPIWKGPTRVTKSHSSHHAAR